jgi:hypothetical protein
MLTCMLILSSSIYNIIYAQMLFNMKKCPSSTHDYPEDIAVDLNKEY